MRPAEPARIHLLPAKMSPYVIILRRKPSKLFHVVRWNTASGDLEFGSWFRGKLFPMRCDVSFDGQWMVYLAMGASGHTWNGVCRPPFLRSILEGPNMGTWFGGGYWRDQNTLLLNRWKPTQGGVPFTIENLNPRFGGEDMSVFYERLARDGWQRVGDNYGENQQIKTAKKYTVECTGDDGWKNRPSHEHPTLHIQYIGYLQHGYSFRFRLDGFPELIGDDVDSACWDSVGNLVFSRRGQVHKYSLHDLRSGEPGQVLDLEPLEPASE